MVRVPNHSGHGATTVEGLRHDARLLDEPSAAWDLFHAEREAKDALERIEPIPRDDLARTG